MKYVLSIFLWIIGGLYYTGFLLITLLLSFLLPVEKFDWLVKKMLRGLFRFIFFKIELEFLEKVDTSQSYIYMINHVSFFDIPLVGGFIPGFVRGIEASRQHKWPLYGWVMRRLGNIPVERENIYASIKSYTEAELFLQKGKSLIIFPEGGRTSDGELRPFKKLPFHLAKKTQKEIIPVAILDMFRVNNKTSLLINPGRIRLKFGEIIGINIINDMDTVSLRDYTKKKIKNLISEQ
ncbi:MAG: 1-acyl-sn-glycerol-3-phosphate acyltransferase [Calditrichaeota bacterium]|nr:1-acyl-sn-glycerol-3-phosphate acyltransferase [Calditrichota bacterium]